MMKPFLLWSQVTWKAMEMAAESAFVIGRRTQQIALAAARPSRADQRELALMVREKHEAFSEAATAAGVSTIMIGEQMSKLALSQMLSASASMMSVMTSLTPAQYATRQSKLLSDTAANSTGAMSKLLDSSAKATRRIMKPVGKRVKQNAKRLAKP
jgi:hypothetical protein